MHTAVKIEPHYHGPTVHVLDASRAVGVAGNLLSDALRAGFVEGIRAEYQDDPGAARGPTARRAAPVASPTPARTGCSIDWKARPPPKPCFLGVRALEDYPLEELVPADRLDPVLPDLGAGRPLPRHSGDPTVGEAARALFRDARELLDRIVRERLLRARGVVGFFRANSVGDDIEVYADAARTAKIGTIHTLRQQMVKPPGRPNLALADFVAPRDSGVADYVGAFAVTAGLGLDELVAGFEAAHDDYNAILAKALADRLAEAFAERLHQRVRTEFWGYARGEALNNEELIEEYQGIRPAPGYPACPDHTEKRELFHLLEAERNAGITLTESFAMLPAQP